MVPYMVTDRDAQGMSKRFTELARICYGPPWTGLRMKKLHKGLVFNPQTLSVSVCSRSGNVFTDIYSRGSTKDERNVTRTSRMSLGTVRTLTDQLRMRYRRATDTNVHTDVQDGKFDFSVMP